MPTGWTVDAIVCTGDTDGGSAVDLGNNKVTIDLAAGEDITRTFTNTQPLTLSKSFDGPTAAGGTLKLTFTITNLDPTSAVADLSFSDNLDDVISGLEATSLPGAPCGLVANSSQTAEMTEEVA